MEANGLKIRELRLSAGLSQRGLAERAHVGYAALCRIERGKAGAHPATLKRLADALGCEVAEFTPEVQRLRDELNQVA